MATADVPITAPLIASRRRLRRDIGGVGLLQVAFLGVLEPLGLSWLATLLYIDAIISPGGTGLLYVGTSSRVSLALARNRYIPRAFSRLSPRGGPFHVGDLMAEPRRKPGHPGCSEPAISPRTGRRPSRTRTRPRSSR